MHVRSHANADNVLLRRAVERVAAKGMHVPEWAVAGEGVGGDAVASFKRFRDAPSLLTDCLFEGCFPASPLGCAGAKAVQSHSQDS